MKQGDLVVRRSYGGDVLFRIEQLEPQRAVLKGVEVRLLADSPVADLMEVPDGNTHMEAMRYQPKIIESARLLEQYRQMQREKNHLILPGKARGEHPYFEMPGKVLHLDGDPAYLRKSMQVYGELRVPAEGHYVLEANMPDALYRLLPRIKPNIVVITGHDGLLKNRKVGGIHHLSSYKNSLNFVNAVKVARQYERNLDTLTIIAGACQSHFEALLQAGANFASSPARILIHALDPVYIAIKMSYTSIKDTINIFDVINHTTSGIKGLGGIESRGSYRIGIPRLTLTNG